MSILQQVPDKMQMILETVPDEVAVDTGLVRRKRKLTGSALTQILVFGWLENPEASYQHLTETAAALGIEVSRQALEQRLTLETTEMLKRTLDATITEMLEVAGRREVLDLLQQFSGVYVQDSTWITLPDELHETWKGQPKKNHPQKAALKLHLCFDVLTGGFQDFQITDGMMADSTAAKAAPPLPEDSLHLADLAYFSLDAFEKLTEEHRLTPKQICVIIGIRWQIELMFKYFKSIGKLQTSRSQKPYRILSEIYAKLIALLIQHVVMLATGWRCIQHTLMKITKFIAGYARLHTVSFHCSTTDLVDTVKTIKKSFENADALQKNTGKNTTFRKLKEAAKNP